MELNQLIELAKIGYAHNKEVCENVNFDETHMVYSEGLNKEVYKLLCSKKGYCWMNIIIQGDSSEYVIINGMVSWITIDTSAILANIVRMGIVEAPLEVRYNELKGEQARG